MNCPSCLCSTSSEVTIATATSSRTYQECQHCGYLWSEESSSRLIAMECHSCADGAGVNIVLPVDATPPVLICRTCGAHWSETAPLTRQ